MNKPDHVAIIMDGNGRWAQSRGRPRTYGHIRGAFVAKKIITEAVDSGIKNLTLFAFSTENWFRPEQEVGFLMRLLAHRLRREHDTLVEKNVRFHVIGDISRLPASVQAHAQQTIYSTRLNTGMNLIFALSYGGRQDILASVRQLAEKVQKGELQPETIDESHLAFGLQTSGLPDPDLILRTSGEQRLSNFFLWQAAYAEIYFTNKHWPDFTAEDFHTALTDYSSRSRRFGRVAPLAIANEASALQEYS